MRLNNLAAIGAFCFCFTGTTFAKSPFVYPYNPAIIQRLLPELAPKYFFRECIDPSGAGNNLSFGMVTSMAPALSGATFGFNQFPVNTTGIIGINAIKGHPGVELIIWDDKGNSSLIPNSSCSIPAAYSFINFTFGRFVTINNQPYVPGANHLVTISKMADGNGQIKLTLQFPSAKDNIYEMEIVKIDILAHGSPKIEATFLLPILIYSEKTKNLLPPPTKFQTLDAILAEWQLKNAAAKSVWDNQHP